MFSSFRILTTNLKACHWFFKTFEPRNRSLFNAIITFIIIPPSVFAFVFRNFYGHLSAAMLLSHTLYITTLFTSIILYRLSPFHPLAEVPGPTIGKISKLWSLYIACTNQQLSYIQKLHAQYGPVVRTGQLLSNHSAILEKINLNSINHFPRSEPSSHCRCISCAYSTRSKIFRKSRT